MKERIRRLIMGGMMALVLMLVCHFQTAEAKAVKLTNKKLKLKVGSWQRISVVNATPKKVKWSLNKAGKKVVKLSQKKLNSKNWGTSVKVKAKKVGKATLTAKITVGKKTYRKKCKITVSKRTSTVANSQKKWSGTVSAAFTSEGWVKIQWSKQSNAVQYYVYRKTGSGSWKYLKATTLLYAKDRSVKENTTYAYRVTAKLNDGSYTEYSISVDITTGEVENSTDTVTPTPTVKPMEGSISTNTGTTTTTTTYEARYSYEVEVLNKFTVYENVPVVLYVKTDNPNPNDFDNVYVSIHGNGMVGYDYSYQDIQYLEQEETNTTFFNKVNGGWIYTVQFLEPGQKTIKIEELEKGENNNNIWQTVNTFQIEVYDGEQALQQHCNNIISIVSDENYNEDGRGNWSALSMQNKLERLEDYVRSHMHYPRVGALTSLGYLPVWYIQENVGAFWETGFADCGAANEMMCVLARTLGLEAERRNTTLDGVLHIQAIVTIAGVEYTYDATPYMGGYQEWAYLL